MALIHCLSSYVVPDTSVKQGSGTYMSQEIRCNLIHSKRYSPQVSTADAHDDESGLFHFNFPRPIYHLFAYGTQISCSLIVHVYAFGRSHQESMVQVEEPQASMAAKMACWYVSSHLSPKSNSLRLLRILRQNELASFKLTPRATYRFRSPR